MLCRAVPCRAALYFVCFVLLCCSYWTRNSWEGGRLFRGVIRIYESRNEDVVKELPCVAQVKEKKDKRFFNVVCVEVYY